MKFLSRLWSAVCCVPYIQKEWIVFISQKSCETSLTFVSSSESEKCKLLFFITPWSIFIWFPNNIPWLPNNLLYCESLNVNLYSYNTSQKLFQVESTGRKIFLKRHHYNTFFKWKKNILKLKARNYSSMLGSKLRFGCCHLFQQQTVPESENVK